MIKVSSDRIMAKQENYLLLGQNCECVLLSNPSECELFSVLFSDGDWKELINQVHSLMPRARGFADLF